MAGPRVAWRFAAGRCRNIRFPPVQLLRNADVYAPEALGHRDVLVAGGRIVWMGERAPVLPPELGVAERDLAGRRLIPGLVDCHVHLTGGGGEAGPESRVPSLPLSAITSAGVTTVVGVLGTDDVTRDTASLLAAARALTAEGITACCYTGGYHLPPVTLTGSVRGDVAQVHEIVGVGEVAIADHRSSQPTLDEVLRLAAEAHVGGMMSGKAGIVHLHLGDGPRGLALVREALAHSELPITVFHPTHVNRRKALFEEALAFARDGGTIDVTCFPVADDEDAWSAEVAIERAWAAGVPTDRITASSDGGGCLPRFGPDGRVSGYEVGHLGALLVTVRALLARGRGLDQALAPFTSNPAALLRLPRKGRIAVGTDADLVVLDERGAVSDVSAAGVWHVRDGAQVMRGTFEGGAS